MPTVRWPGVIPMEDFEIQYGASLTVRDSQMAVFVNEGKVADVGLAGEYAHHPDHPGADQPQELGQFRSRPFKSDVYFFSTRLQLGRKWGTPQPIRDKLISCMRLRASACIPASSPTEEVLHRDQRHPRRIHRG